MSELHETLHATLAVLASSDRGLHRFGAAHHRYQPAPPLAPHRVAELERAAGAALPDDYREHLVHVGDGGAGPHLGLLPFDHPVQQRMLAGAFDPRDPWHGAVALAHAGCGHVALLVVEGPARGQVWAVSVDEAQVGPVHESFLAWYLAWIDCVARGQPQPPLIPPGTCRLPEVLTRYLHAVEDERGIARDQLSPEAVREAIAAIGDGAIELTVRGGGPLFDAGDRLDPCVSCAQLADRLGIRAGAFVPGVAPIPARRAAAA